MLAPNPAIVEQLKNLARNGIPASQMMRRLIGLLAPEHPHKVTMIKYMRSAFHLTLQEASSIPGWSAEGNGELDDKRLDELVGPEIAKHRQEWDVS